MMVVLVALSVRLWCCSCVVFPVLVQILFGDAGACATFSLCGFPVLLLLPNFLVVPPYRPGIVSLASRHRDIL